MLESKNTVLVLVDVQVKLVRAMAERESLIGNVAKLVRGARVLGVPIVWTEQNPAGLGPTEPRIAELLDGESPGDLPISKLSFSCCGEPGFTEAMDRLGRNQVLLAGMEAHVCVYQTAVDLLAVGYEVQVVADAVCSRTPDNKEIALAKVRAAGGDVTSVETALFELLEVARGPAFKEILEIVK